MLAKRPPGIRTVLFKACVALRQVLAARRQKSVRRATKAALVGLIAWLAGSLLLAAGQDFQQVPSVLKTPVSQAPVAHNPVTQTAISDALPRTVDPRIAIPRMTPATSVSSKSDLRITQPPQLLPSSDAARRERNHDTARRGVLRGAQESIAPGQPIPNSQRPMTELPFNEGTTPLPPDERYLPRSESRRPIDQPADDDQASNGYPVKPLGRLSTSIAPTTDGDLPANRAEPFFDDQGEIVAIEAPNREWAQYSYYWAASAFCHQPLYFEETNLERYGHSAGHCLQPVLSGAHFFATIPILPYKMALDHPSECVYTLGHYRPGSCAPWQRHACRVTPDAIFAQGATTAGLILLIP